MAPIALVLLIQSAEAKFPLNVFKGVTDCLSDNKKYLSPTIGIAALDGNVMENFRFYGNFEATYRLTKEGLERDYANDHSKDPLWQLARLLFPSTAGQLSGDSAHRYNFGKHVNNPKTVALLINYTDDVRSGNNVDVEQLENNIMASMGHVFKDKLSMDEKVTIANQILHQDKRLINDILLEAQLAVEGHGNKTVRDQRLLGEAKGNLLQILSNKAKRISNPRITTMFIDKISQLYGHESYSHPKHDPSRTPLAVKPDYFHHVLTEINQAKIAAEEIINHTSIEDLVADVEKKEPKQTFIIHFKKETLTPLLEAIKNAILTEKSERDGFYPQYTPEQIILAFFAYKFSTRDDIKAFLTHLKPEIIKQEAVDRFEASDLLTLDDLPQIAKKEIHTPDDILALSTSDMWDMPTPYRVGVPILSNGNTQKYDRKTDSFIPGTFADCVEISIRHLINCFLYNLIERLFNFKGLEQYQMRNPLSPDQEANFAAFMNFYKIQSVDLANDGSIEIRSQWNRVVGDLNAPNEPAETKVRYRQETNELDAGFINLMKVFHKVLGIRVKPAPLPTSSLNDKKQWLKESFEEVFKAVTPYKGYSIHFNMDNVNEIDEEISGLITISVHNSQGMLYSFDFKSDPDRHGQMENYQVNDRLIMESYSSFLQSSSFKGIGSENTIWLLAKDSQLRESKNLPEFYQWFGTSLSDNEAKIGFLTKIEQFYGSSQTLTLPNQLKTSLKNIIKNLSLDDALTLNKAAPVLLNLLEREETKDHVHQSLESTKFGNYYTDLNPESVALISKAISLNNFTLMSLELMQSKIGSNGATALAKALETNTILSSLKLRFTKIGSDGLKAFAGTLKINKTLSSLDLSYNYIGGNDLPALGLALMLNKTLFSLDLSFTDIGDNIAKNLAKALKTNKTLSSLNLSSNQIGDDGATALVEALKTNTTLSFLDLSSNKIGEAKKRELSQLFPGRIKF